VLVEGVLWKVVGFHSAERVDGDAQLVEVLAAMEAVRPGGHRGCRQVGGRGGAVAARLANRIGTSTDQSGRSVVPGFPLLTSRRDGPGRWLASMGKGPSLSENRRRGEYSCSGVLGDPGGID
jgi:hypothetical protein